MEIRIRCVVVDFVVIERRRPRRIGTFLVTSVGLHHHLESEDKGCTEPPEGSSALAAQVLGWGSGTGGLDQ